MSEEKDIDKIRSRGGKTDIGTKEDGAIIEMYNLGGKLLVIKERAVYELLTADMTDPQRENINLPPTTQKLLLRMGTESENFCRTFLTARRFFNAGFLSEYLDSVHAMNLTLEAMQELSVLEEEIVKYMNDEAAEGRMYDERKSKKGTDHLMPSLPDLKSRCKTIFQKVDHFFQSLMDIIRLFYPDFSKKEYYTQFAAFLKKEYGEDNGFYKFIAGAVPFVKLTKDIRNCLDHRRTELKIEDYQLQVNGDIYIPTIEMDGYSDLPLERMSLAAFLQVVSANLPTIFEETVVHLCNTKLPDTGLMYRKIGIIPVEERVNKFIKYAYWHSLPPNGFFQQ